jgi:hypothetical protein
MDGEGQGTAGQQGQQGEGTQTGGSAQQGESVGQNPARQSGSAQQGDQGAQSGEGESFEERIEKLAQARAESMLDKLGKTNSKLEKELKKLRREKLSAEELRELEIREREEQIATKAQEVRDKENRLYAISALKTAGLDNGSNDALSLVELVLGDDETAIDTKVNALKAVIDKMVESKVGEAIKSHGRVPGTGNTKPTGSGDKTIAEKLGKSRADAQKKYDDVLKHYTR